MRPIYLLVFVGFTTIFAGCSRSNNMELDRARAETEAARKEANAAIAIIAKIEAEATKRTELPSDGWWHLEGRVTCKSDLVESGQEDAHERKFAVPKGTVSNVLIWLHAPENRVFKLPPTKTWPIEARIDKPFAEFTPRVVILFPKHFDVNTQTWKPTGQMFQLSNSSNLAESVSLKAGNAAQRNSSFNLPSAVKGKASLTPVTLEPDSFHPHIFASEVHGWIRAYAWVFEHPYATLTNDLGNYTFTHLPAGVVVRIMAWHERTGYILGKEGYPIMMEAGARVHLDLKVAEKETEVRFDFTVGRR